MANETSGLIGIGAVSLFNSPKIQLAVNISNNGGICLDDPVLINKPAISKVIPLTACITVDLLNYPKIKNIFVQAAQPSIGRAKIKTTSLALNPKIFTSIVATGVQLLQAIKIEVDPQVQALAANGRPRAVTYSLFNTPSVNFAKLIEIFLHELHPTSAVLFKDLQAKTSAKSLQSSLTSKSEVLTTRWRHKNPASHLGLTSSVTKGNLYNSSLGTTSTVFKGRLVSSNTLVASKPAKTFNKFEQSKFITTSSSNRIANKFVSSQSKVSTSNVKETQKSLKSRVRLGSTISFVRGKFAISNATVVSTASRTRIRNRELNSVFTTISTAYPGKFLKNVLAITSLPSKTLGRLRSSTINIALENIVKTPTKGVHDKVGLGTSSWVGKTPQDILRLVSLVSFLIRKQVHDNIRIINTANKQPVKSINNVAALKAVAWVGQLAQDTALLTSQELKQIKKPVLNTVTQASRNKKFVVKDTKQELLSIRTLFAAPGKYLENRAKVSSSLVKIPNKGIKDSLTHTTKIVKDVVKGTKQELIAIDTALWTGRLFNSKIRASISLVKTANKGIKDKLTQTVKVSKIVRRPVNSSFVTLTDLFLGRVYFSTLATKAALVRDVKKGSFSSVGLNASKINFSQSTRLPPNNIRLDSTIFKGLPASSNTSIRTSLLIRDVKKQIHTTASTISLIKIYNRKIHSSDIVFKSSVIPAKAVMSFDNVELSSETFVWKSKDLFSALRGNSTISIKFIKNIITKTILFSTSIPAYAVIRVSRINATNTINKNPTKNIKLSIRLHDINKKYFYKGVKTNTVALSKTIVALADIPISITNLKSSVAKQVRKVVQNTVLYASKRKFYVSKEIVNNLIIASKFIFKGNLRQSLVSVNTEDTIYFNKQPKSFVGGKSLTEKDVSAVRQDSVGLVNSGLLLNQNYALDYFADAYVGEQRVLN
jgi:hypothetical protein